MRGALKIGKEQICLLLYFERMGSVCAWGVCQKIFASVCAIIRSLADMNVNMPFTSSIASFCFYLHLFHQYQSYQLKSC